MEIVFLEDILRQLNRVQRRNAVSLDLTDIVTLGESTPQLPLINEPQHVPLDALSEVYQHILQTVDGIDESICTMRRPIDTLFETVLSFQTQFGLQLFYRYVSIPFLTCPSIR